MLACEPSQHAAYTLRHEGTLMRTSPFEHIAVVGAGAVGSFFGAMLARAGHQVTLIGRPAHVKAIESHGLRLDLAHADGVQTVRLNASTDFAALRTADLVLFCVKSTDTVAVAYSMAAHVAPDAIIMSLQNGVENVALIASALANPVIPTVVYVATEITAPGCVKHNGRGELLIGSMQACRLDNAPEVFSRIAGLFASAQVPVRISQNVMADLWSKLLINCVFNAVSGLTQTSYGQLEAVDGIQTTQSALVREVLAVAHADGTALDEATAMQAVALIYKTMAGQKSSTAQDIARHKLSEIDHLNGFVMRRGQALGVPTPVNQAMVALVKLVESTYIAPG
jgi:2-dehydropantoate 2-reductase